MMPAAGGAVLRSPHGNGRAFGGRTMTLTRQHVREILNIYIRAWETQDPGLIVTIFTPAATYHERVLGEPIPDREAIRDYWQTKVVQAQANIRCELLSLYLDGDTAIAEWEAQFDDVTQGVRKRMREIAVLEFDGPLIASLREYWASERTGELGAAPGQLGP
jgi:SnoaL-like domain